MDGGACSLSDNHRALVPRIEEKKVGLDDVMKLLGGLIQDEDVPVMKAAGVRRSSASALAEDIAAYIRRTSP